MDVMDAEMTRVILVEDHKMIRDVLKSLIEQVDNCHVIVEAVCGLEAIDIIGKVQADLIILDMSLPGCGGLEVLKAAKKTGMAKILALTMMTETEHIQAALDAGADGICLKDRGVITLKKAIMEVLYGRHPVYLEKQKGPP
jgi:two-component system, NarL family, nitrate/nitrite response regulator NarL